MAIQVRLDIANLSFIKQGSGLVREAETLEQEAGRTADMVFGTIMAQNPSSLNWVPLTDVTLATGEQLPQGVLLRTIATADLVAGDVDDVPIMVKGEILDIEQVVLENSLTLASIITHADLPLNMTVEAWLAQCNIYLEATMDYQRYENS